MMVRCRYCGTDMKYEDFFDNYESCVICHHGLVDDEVECAFCKELVPVENMTHNICNECFDWLIKESREDIADYMEKELC